MKDFDQKEQMTRLLERVDQNDRTKFHLLKSVQEYSIAKKWRTAIKYVVIGFENTASKLFNSYLIACENGEDQLELLVSYKKILHCIEFYKQEFAVASDMLAEYRCYTMDGRIFRNLVMQQERPAQDLVDWRKLPWKIF